MVLTMISHGFFLPGSMFWQPFCRSSRLKMAAGSAITNTDAISVLISGAVRTGKR
jgi:hypothetical protein